MPFPLNGQAPFHIFTSCVDLVFLPVLFTTLRREAPGNFWPPWILSIGATHPKAISKLQFSVGLRIKFIFQNHQLLLLRASPISDFRTKLGICPNQPVCESRPPWLGKEKTTFSENPSWATPLNKVERWTVLNLVDCSLSHTLGIYQKANYCKIPLKCQRCDRCLERWSSDICKQNSRRTVMTAFLVQYQVIILQQSFFSLQTGHLTQN